MSFYRAVVATLVAASLLACNGTQQPVEDASAQDAPLVQDAGHDNDSDLAPIDASVGDLDGPPDVTSDTWCEDPGVQLGNGIIVKPTNLAPGGPVTVIYDTSGQLGGSSNLTLHYGFNFWSLDLGGEIAKDAPMTPRPDGSFEVTITPPADARLLDFVFYTTNGSDKQWDNNNKADYHRGVGVPYSGPYLTWRDNTLNPGAKDRDPAHSVTVSFRSDRPCQGRVRYGTPGSVLNQEVSGTPGKLFHHIHLKGLAADTVYHYQVDCTDPSASGGCQVPEASPVYSFRTATSAPTSFTFVVLSDPQDNNNPNDLWSEVADQLTKPLYDDARFVIISGDLTGDDQPDRWWTFFHKGHKLLASKVLMPVAGNHDTPTWNSSATAQSFDELFDLESSSGQDTSYGIVYGSGAFLGLNSETSQVSGTDWLPGGTQYKWVQGSLAKLSTTWRFAFWHIPPYNAGARHSNQAGSTRPITKLFNGEVDWVFCGHEHLYQRFQPIRYVGEDSNGKVISQVVSTYGRGPGDGVGYLVSTTAGHYTPADSLLPASDPARAMLAYPTSQQIVSDKIAPWVGFVTVEVKGKTITIQSHAYGSTAPKDTVSYTKP